MVCPFPRKNSFVLSTSKEQKIKVLFVAANPMMSTRLAIDEQIRSINQNILLSEHRDLIDMQVALAARPSDLLQSFNRYRPHVVHFAGHGRPGTLLFSNQNGRSVPVGSDALKALFMTLKDNIRVVLLDACYSRMQAEAITEIIDCTIGMNESLTDGASITFSAAFYQAIGFGRSIQEAFEQGKTALLLTNSTEYTKPVLLVKSGVDASQVCLISAPLFSQKSVANIQDVEEMLWRSDYDAAYRKIDKLIRTVADELSLSEQAKLKYLEALVHLEGRRPYVHSLSVMQVVERLLSTSAKLHNLYSYNSVLAVFKRDFARNGFPLYNTEANILMNYAQSLVVQEVDRANIKLLAYVQEALYKDCSSYFKA